MPRPSNEKMFAVDMAVKYAATNPMGSEDVFDFARKVEEFINADEEPSAGSPAEPKRRVGFV